jgi:hypothetical protein
VEEGVIQFAISHDRTPLSGSRLDAAMREISSWRTILHALSLIGADPQRYDGYGFGNISARIGAPSSPRGHRSFLITGTQTGKLATLDPQHYARVDRYDFVKNAVVSQGECEPSSEAMTHGALYDISPAVRAVIHAHSPTIFEAGKALRLPTTPNEVGYGTPQMARSVQSLMSQSALWEKRLLIMGGHQDGVVAFGRSMAEAGQALICGLAAAHALM